MAKRRRGEERPRCAACKRALSAGARGRPRRYCSGACRQRAYRRRRDGEQKRGLVKLYEADARDFLAALPDQSVDLIVTDPPYVFDRGDSRFRDWFAATLDDDEWPALFAQLYRVLGADADCYVLCDERTKPIFDEAAEAAGFRVRRPIIWNKGSLGLGDPKWRAQYEYVLRCEKGYRPPNFKNRGDVITCKRISRRYPTEKPVPLLRQLMSQSSKRGELVLDPFCGSGSTGQAARELGRRAVLCDVDAAVAARRLRNAIERAARVRA